MPQWTVFAGFTVVIVGFVLLLARASQSIIAEKPEFSATDVEESPNSAEPTDDVSRPPETGVSTAWLLVNVALTQGILAALIIGAIWYTDIPVSAIGIQFVGFDWAWTLAMGVGIGAVLYVGAEIGATMTEHLGFDRDESLRAWLAPRDFRGWIVLLLVVLPVIAVFEELLFRAALIGVLSAGYGISPWILAVISSILFAFGHGAQGHAGMLVTGLLGLALAAVFIVFGSILIVVIAHYVVNTLEFVIHEGIGVELIG